MGSAAARYDRKVAFSVSFPGPKGHDGEFPITAFKEFTGNPKWSDNRLRGEVSPIGDFNWPTCRLYVHVA